MTSLRKVRQSWGARVPSFTTPSQKEQQSATTRSSTSRGEAKHSSAAGPIFDVINFYIPQTQPILARESLSAPQGATVYPRLGLDGREVEYRVKTACVNCKNSKTRCDNQRPCKRCVRTGRQDSCIDSVHKKRSRGIGSSGRKWKWTNLSSMTATANNLSAPNNAQASWRQSTSIGGGKSAITAASASILTPTLNSFPSMDVPIPTPLKGGAKDYSSQLVVPPSFQEFRRMQEQQQAASAAKSTNAYRPNRKSGSVPTSLQHSSASSNDSQQPNKRQRLGTHFPATENSASSVPLPTALQKTPNKRPLSSLIPDSPLMQGTPESFRMADKKFKNATSAMISMIQLPEINLTTDDRVQGSPTLGAGLLATPTLSLPKIGKNAGFRAAVPSVPVPLSTPVPPVLPNSDEFLKPKEKEMKKEKSYLEYLLTICNEQLEIWNRRIRESVQNDDSVPSPKGSQRKQKHTGIHSTSKGSRRYRTRRSRQQQQQRYGIEDKEQPDQQQEETNHDPSKVKYPPRASLKAYQWVARCMLKIVKRVVRPETTMTQRLGRWESSGGKTESHLPSGLDLLSSSSSSKDDEKPDAKEIFYGALPIGVTVISLYNSSLSSNNRPWVNKTLADYLGYVRSVVSRLLNSVNGISLLFMEAMCERKENYSYETKWIHSEGHVVSMLESVSIKYKSNGVPLAATVFLQKISGDRVNELGQMELGPEDESSENEEEIDDNEEVGVEGTDDLEHGNVTAVTDPNELFAPDSAVSCPHNNTDISN